MSYCVDKGISHDEWLSWSPESRSKTVAYLMESAQTCQLCGTAPWEWEENRFAYEPSDHFCHGCYLKEIASEEAGSMPGTTVELIPVTAQRRAQQAVDRQRRSQMNQDDEQE